MKKLKSLACGFGCALLAFSANASLLDGLTLNYQYYFPDSFSAYSNASNGSFVVGPGVEVSNIVDNVGTMDVSDTQIVIQFTSSSSFTPGSFNGFVLSGLSPSGFTGVTLDAASTMPGFTQADLAFTTDSISANWADLSFSAGQEVILDVGGSVAAVPEPDTYALMLAGLGMLGVMIKSRRGARA